MSRAITVFPVRVYFDSFGNHSPDKVIGQVRRLADEEGRPGIIGKRGQTTKRVLRKGYLRIVWPTRKSARRYQQAVAEFWGHLARTKRYRRRQ
jgi:hypothetical protein